MLTFFGKARQVFRWHRAIEAMRRGRDLQAVEGLSRLRLSKFRSSVVKAQMGSCFFRMHRYDEAIENYSLAIELTREVKDFGSNVEAQYVAMYCNLFSAVSRRKIGFLGTRDEETSMYNSLICFPVGDDLRTRLLPLPLRSSFGM